MVSHSSRVQHALRVGVLVKEPCRMCGKEAEAHHEDYARPLDVTWLCRSHHARLHAQKRRLQPRPVLARSITPDEVLAIEAHFGWSASALAREFHISRQTVWRWLSGEPIGKWNAYKLGKLKERMAAQG